MFISNVKVNVSYSRGLWPGSSIQASSLAWQLLGWGCRLFRRNFSVICRVNHRARGRPAVACRERSRGNYVGGEIVEAGCARRGSKIFLFVEGDSSVRRRQKIPHHENSGTSRWGTTQARYNACSHARAFVSLGPSSYVCLFIGAFLEIPRYASNGLDRCYTLANSCAFPFGRCIR